MSIISADDYEPPLQLVQPKSYTLAELERLAREFIGYADTDNYERRLFLSVLFAWLKRREREQP